MSITINEGLEMHNPPHPGGVFRRLYLEPTGLTVGEVAKHLGVTRKTLSQLINEHAAISPEMALRIGKATDTTPESWLEMEAYYQLWQVKK